MLRTHDAHSTESSASESTALPDPFQSLRNVNSVRIPEKKWNSLLVVFKKYVVIPHVKILVLVNVRGLIIHSVGMSGCDINLFKVLLLFILAIGHASLTGRIYFF